ncbi:hypothetical protein Btru_043778 [Bulinus truncatus]|nr:hypothetical protein Btru_043778 [Bulinus truncatus]
MLILKLIVLSAFVVLCNSASNISENVCPTIKLDIVIVLDTSTSVTELNFRKSQDFIRNILTPLPIEPDYVRVALVRYSTNVQIVSHLNSSMEKTDKLKAVSSIPYIYGDTSTDLALQDVRKKVLVPHNGDRQDVHDLVILINDGVSQRRKATLNEAKLLKDRSNLQILAIGVTNNIDETELKSISSGANMFLKIKSFSDLNYQLNIIKSFVCSSAFQETNMSSTFASASTPPYTYPWTTLAKHKAATGKPKSIKNKLSHLNVSQQDVASTGMDRSATKKYPFSFSPPKDIGRGIIDSMPSSDLLVTSTSLISMSSNVYASNKEPMSGVIVRMSSFTGSVKPDLSSLSPTVTPMSSLSPTVTPMSLLSPTVTILMSSLSHSVTPELSSISHSVPPVLSSFPTPVSTPASPISISTTSPISSPAVSYSTSSAPETSTQLSLSAVTHYPNTAISSPTLPSIKPSISSPSSASDTSSSPLLPSSVQLGFFQTLPSANPPLISSKSSPVILSPTYSLYSLPSSLLFASQSSHSILSLTYSYSPPSKTQLLPTSMFSSNPETLTQFLQNNYHPDEAPLLFIASLEPTSSRPLTVDPQISTVLPSLSIHASPTIQDDSPGLSILTASFDHTVNFSISMASSSAVWISTNLSTHVESSTTPDVDNNRTLYIYLGATAAGLIAVLISGMLLAVAVRKSQSRSEEEN